MDRGVQRWAVNASAWAPSRRQFDFCVGLLPPSESSPVLRLINFEDQKKALISRLLQRKLVHSLLGIDYDSIIIERTREGKPYLVNKVEDASFPNYNFNVSHHGDYVVLVSEPLCLVGVDVMTHDPRYKEPPAEFFQTFSSCYTQSEWDTINRAGPEAGALLDQFYRFWCMKEAYIKAVGIGLGFELQRAEFYYQGGNTRGNLAHLRIDGKEKPDWQFYLHRLGTDHWVCVARGPPAEAVESYRKTLQRVEFDTAAYGAALALPNKTFTLLTIEDLIPGGILER